MGYALQFVRDRLRIRDVRLYVKDLLLEYHRLQQFTPRVSPRARCIDWARMLQEFEWPHYKEVGSCGICTVTAVLAAGLCADTKPHPCCLDVTPSCGA